MDQIGLLKNVSKWVVNETGWWCCTVYVRAWAFSNITPSITRRSAVAHHPTRNVSRRHWEALKNINTSHAAGATRLWLAVPLDNTSLGRWLAARCLSKTKQRFKILEASRGALSHCVSGSTCGAQVHIVWNLRSSSGQESGGGLLQVTPPEADVQAGESLAFRVGLFPSKGNCYFAEEAEAFVSPANQMSFR